MGNLKLDYEFFLKEYSFFIYYCLGAIILIIIFIIFQPKYKKFKSMELYNVIWRWRWKNKEIFGLACYCPVCKKELDYDDEYAKTAKNMQDKITFFICQKCGGVEKGRIKGGDREYAKKILKRQILIEKSKL